VDLYPVNQKSAQNVHRSTPG